MYKKILVLLLVLFLFAISCQPLADKNAAKSEIKQLIAKYNQAFDAKDFDQFVSFCHENFRFFTLDGQVLDKQATPSFLTKILEEWDEIHSQVQNLEIDSDRELAFARYTVVYNYETDGLPNSMTAQITVVFKKEAKKWQMYHFHMSRRYF
ncbi:MAG: nuclear transport factor 2 family protein [Calditrichaeota bacterium]|nr:nuclear transport factor 2 family protein [Calditrichota bacterium]